MNMLLHRCRNKMVGVQQMTFSNALSSIRMIKIWLEFGGIGPINNHSTLVQAKGLVPNKPKPLPESTLTNMHSGIWRPKVGWTLKEIHYIDVVMTTVHGVSNHQPHGCLLSRLFRRRTKKTSKLRVTGLCVGNSPGPVTSPHKGPVTRKMFPFDDVIMSWIWIDTSIPYHLANRNTMFKRICCIQCTVTLCFQNCYLIQNVILIINTINTNISTISRQLKSSSN